ncbi:MAG: hypothetical protein H6622_02010 [Halobacteriovoraceae bacterium]|nr:hypothetical protein [Halobacteriovoraceae bacterium]
MSQKEINLLMGHSFNQVAKWETGVTHIKWENFTDMCVVLDIPIIEIFKKFFNSYNNSLDLKNFYHSLNIQNNLQGSSDSRTRKIIHKILKTQTSVDLADIFYLIDTRPSMLIGFLSNFVDCSQIDILQEKYLTFVQSLDLIDTNPLVIYINAALQLDPYQSLKEHDDDLLAHYASCSIKEVKKTLNQMYKLDLIYYKNKKFYPCLFDFSFPFLRDQRLRNFAKYTMQLTADKFPTEHESVDWSSAVNYTLSSTRVCAMSVGASEEIGRLISQLHDQIRKVIENDKGKKENVQVVLTQLYPVNIYKK